MKMQDFLYEFGNPVTIINVMRSYGLLASHAICENCREEMSEQKTDKGDALIFYCGKRTCRQKKSIRYGSFFRNARLSLCKCMLFIHLWSKGYTEKLIMSDYDFAQQTVVDWARFCRDVCIEHYETSDEKIGGVGITIEIDETLIVKRKYDRGNMFTQVGSWLKGGYLEA